MHEILVAGAALVGLPILLHLIMKQEPKRLSFPAFRFLTQKLRTNQRKLRLRHFILLALRMLLIALFCLALYQPTLLSERFNIRGEQPVAVVIVIDTSPSMGYTADEKSRLEEARRRAQELLNELPRGSHVAVVSTADASGQWQDVETASKTLLQLDRPRGGNQPLTAAIAEGYRLLATVDQETEASEPLPKMLAVFTDRAAASWDAARTDDLKKLIERIPDPKPTHAVVDVGLDHPTNVAILSAEMKPQVIAANQTTSITLTVAATGPASGPPLEAVVLAKVTGGDKLHRKSVTVTNGGTGTVVFDVQELIKPRPPQVDPTPGLYQVEFSLESSDRLPFDNKRFLTFRVGEARRILTISDDPQAAAFWQEGHNSKREFTCLVVTPDQVKTTDTGRTVVVPDPSKPTQTEDIREFEVVCLLAVADPNQPAGNTLWDKLSQYVFNGGKLVVIPGGETLSLEGYAAATHLLPATFKSIIDTQKLTPPPPKQTAPGWDEPKEGKNGVTWALDDPNDRIIQHPMLRPYQAWRAKGNVDAVKYPRRARKYWDVQKTPDAAVIVAYNDAEKPADRRPAVLERFVSDPRNPKTTKGRVLLLTTRLEVPTVADPAWNDYWELDNSSWYVVFPWLVGRYMAGDTTDANFNYLVGSTVPVVLPRGGVPKGTGVVIDGPGIPSSEARIDVDPGLVELRVRPPRTNQPGNFVLSVDAVKWKDGFSLNVPADESTLEKAAVESIEELTGKDTVVPVGRDGSLIDALRSKGAGKQPLDLFPWLLILVLLLLALEGLVANRFYRKVK